MTDLNVRTYSNWPFYCEDAISEWYEEYERTVELFTELSNLHGGVRCEGLSGTWCSACEKITGDGLSNLRYLNFINNYPAPEDR